MFSLYKYLIVSLFFSHLGFWSGNLFLTAPFPDLCLLVPFQYVSMATSVSYDMLTIQTATCYCPFFTLYYKADTISTFIETFLNGLSK